MLRHHGAVEIEVDRVDPLRPFEILQNLARDPLEGVLRHLRRRLGRGPGERLQLMPQRAGLVSETGNGDVHPGHGLEQTLPSAQRRPATAFGEGPIGGLGRREGVGLVLEAADGDARHLILPVVSEAPVARIYLGRPVQPKVPFLLQAAGLVREGHADRSLEAPAFGACLPVGDREERLAPFGSRSVTGRD